MMRPGSIKVAGVAVCAAPALIVLALVTSAAHGDEPGRLSRFFRFGQGSAPTALPRDESALDGPGAPIRMVDPGANSVPSSAALSQPQPRLIPQPRVARAVTDADPIVSRISLARSDDGRSFGMFLQVYADGTVIDSDGAHSLGKESVKGIFRALEASELYRLKGHCGGPATDFVEHVQMVVYERSLRGLRANAFSFSGNPQGCDHAVQHLQKALDELQAKLGRNASEVPGSPMISPNQAGRPSAPILLNSEPNPGR